MTMDQVVEITEKMNELFESYSIKINKDNPPTPYTKVMGPTKTPLGFKMVFLKRVLSIIKPSNEYKKKEFI